MHYVNIVFPPYRVMACAGGLPELYEYYREHAVLADEIDLPAPENAAVCYFGVGRQEGWPSLVVAQQYDSGGDNFYPGILIVPETAIAFIGAGERVLAYRIEPRPEKLWTDTIFVGFWHWERHGDFVLASAELQLAAWTIDGAKKWTMSVEPPWDYTVTDGLLTLDVDGTKSEFRVEDGPSPPR